MFEFLINFIFPDYRKDFKNLEKTAKNLEELISKIERKQRMEEATKLEKEIKDGISKARYELIMALNKYMVKNVVK